MEPEADLREDDGGGDEAVAVTPLEIVDFIRHAAGRHRWLGIIVGFSVAVIGVAVALVIPPKYAAQTRILASQSAAIAAALSTPNRPVNTNADPFTGSAEILKQKSNLIWMVKEADILTQWRAYRSLPFRMKDALFDLVRGPASDANQVMGLAELLDQQMQVYHDNSVLTIEVYWRDQNSTLKLAQLAQARFLELRRTQELSAITAAISINEEEVKHAADGIDLSLEELIRIRQRARDSARVHPAGSASADSTRAPRTSSRSTGLSAPAGSGAPPTDKKTAARLADIRQQERDLEVPWQRRIAELKFQLSDLRATYGPEHPTVLQQEAKIKDASGIPSELQVLRERERQLLSEIEQKSLEEVKSTNEVASVRPSSAAAPQPPTASSRLISADGALLIAEREDDPVVAPAKANLTSAIQRYTEITKRLETARLELTSAQVALQYRFVVVNEPERPRKPLKPNRPVIILGVLLAAALFGLLAGAIRDLLSGKLVEPWQVRILGLDIIGEVKIGQKSQA